MNIDHLEIYQSDRIGLIGKNENGKITLLHILYRKIVPEENIAKQFSHCELIPRLKLVKSTKSGGEVTRNYIRQVLDKNPELLLADEPATNLNNNYIEKLEQDLKNWHRAFIIVSHDRAFLDNLCTTIWEIDEGRITEYKGSYSNYIKQKELERHREELECEKYEGEKKRLGRTTNIKEQKAQQTTKELRNLSLSEGKIKVTKPYFASKQKELRKIVKSLETRLEKLERVEKRNELPPLKVDLANLESVKNRTIIRGKDVSGTIEGRVLWKAKSFSIRGGNKMTIIGSSDTGKTTFVKKIVHGNPGISLSPPVEIGYFSQKIDALELDKSILESIQSSSQQNEALIRTILARVHLFRDNVYKPIDVLSGRERAKVTLTGVLLNETNTLILGEPTNFLGVGAIKAPESLLKEYNDSVTFVSHDRKFIEKVTTRIMTIDNKETKVFDGTYGQFKQAEKPTRDTKEDKKLLFEIRITRVPSRLGIEPSEKLGQKFQNLMNEKRNLDK